MIRQLLFASVLLITLAAFAFTSARIYRFFRLTRPGFPVRNIGRRFRIMLAVAFTQTKILRKPVIGFFHVLVFWGFCWILFGSIEMVIDGLSGSERALKFLGPVYDILTASGDVFAALIVVSILIFLARRTFIHIRRFEGIEMKKISHIDAEIALLMILFLMVTLIGINTSYLSIKHAAGLPVAGTFPVSFLLTGMLSALPVNSLKILLEVCWWSHILLIFVFANILPYSKHFHVFMSVPNVFLTRPGPLGRMTHMEQVTREVRLMLDPSLSQEAQSSGTPERFGIRDCEDATWKNYLDSLACTECGRCTSVCPANLTGKKLSPRKIVMDLRARMKEKGPHLVREGKAYTDHRSLLRDYITEEELWACTTCNACAKECPININQPEIILDMRRYLVMEEGSAPAAIKACFSNIENNGAPWKFSPEDRLLWAKGLQMKIHES
ncbi:MAG TPA: 4Fe-4S dicluster domain-containing protein [Bacteroidales bacterium]|nr:4Fe-4S dicluster domain-containing protein [Bacteroidales bacterium]